MQITHFTLTLSTLLFYFLITFTLSSTFFSSTTATAASNKHNEPQDLIHSSCIHSRYPRLCLRTLYNYVGPTKTPLDMAQAGLKVSLAHADRASKYIKKLSAAPGSLGQSPTSKRQRVALHDCVEQMADSVDELRKSLEELQHLRPETFRWQMSNTQTWVSAAITDGDTCLDGFGSDGGDDNDGKVKQDVKRRVNDVAMVTSNALYMINRLGQGDARKRKHPRGGSSGSKN